ncbi:hypothetical protein DY000_02005356 [Brassica cretica]|uniref:Uncharacterized protein n=1 Tax=Brassica cretica TaxID=69181 RepID=A0ABQ7CJG4_BRACR|nr:hypothetical protein DY000_02005356 [Brassica cretica]
MLLKRTYLTPQASKSITASPGRLLSIRGSISASPEEKESTWVMGIKRKSYATLKI